MANNSKPGLIVRWLCLSAAIAAMAWLLPGISVEGGVGHLLGIAAVLALINMIVRPILIFLSLPAVVISLGLFLLVINAVTLSWAGSLTGWMHIRGFGWAVLGSVIITVVSSFLQRQIAPRSPAQNRYLQS